MTELADRVALVTGGACGQGRAHAVALAAAGATVSRAVLYLVTDPGRTSGSVLEVNLATSAVASEGASAMTDADTMNDADATTAGPPSPLVAAGVLTAATRRLMRAAATTGLPPERVLELAGDIHGLADALDTLPRDRAHQTPFDAEREAEIRAGKPWRMFRFNPLGIPLAITVRDGVARTELTPDALFEGPPDWLHGGFAAAILDVVLSTVVMVEAEPAYTARLDVHFRRGTVLDRSVVCESRLVSTDGRKIEAHGWIAQDGHRTVEAQGLFVPMRRPA